MPPCGAGSRCSCKKLPVTTTKRPDAPGASGRKEDLEGSLGALILSRAQIMQGADRIRSAHHHERVLIRGRVSSAQRSPCMSSRAQMYRQRAADAKQRAAQAKDPSIRIALEHEAAFWLLLAEQMDWIDKGRSIPSATKGVSLSLYRHSWEYNSTLIGSSSIRTGRRWLRDSHVPACERVLCPWSELAHKLSPKDTGFDTPAWIITVSAPTRRASSWTRR